MSKGGNVMLTEDLTKLKNTLNLIEVRGESVKVLSNCMFYIEQMIADVQNGKYNPDQTPEKKD